MPDTADRPRRATVVEGVVATLVTIAVALVLAEVLRLARRPGRARGVLLQLVGRRPDPDVDDLTLADRVRSELGPVLKQLDLPHVHVMVVDHVAQLHGDVRWPRDAAAIERAVRRVSGVRDVQAHLHRGLLPSDTRPSRGRAVPRPPSRVKQRLVEAASSSGLEPQDAEAFVRATLAVFTARLPEDERRQLVAHLPEDVRLPLRRTTLPDVSGMRTVDQLVDVISSAAGPGISCDAPSVGAVLGEVRRAVPEEALDVVAVLPRELGDLWSDGAER